MRTFAVVAALSLALSGPSGQGRRAGMTAPPDLLAVIERSASAALAGDGRAEDAVELAAARTPWRGLHVVAGKPEPSAEGVTAPVLILAQQTGLEAWRTPLKGALTLAVADPDTGAVRLLEVLHDPKDEEWAGEPPPPRPAPKGGAAEALHTKLYRYEASVPKSFGADATLTALAFDMGSNTAALSPAATPTPDQVRFKVSAGPRGAVAIEGEIAEGADVGPVSAVLLRAGKGVFHQRFVRPAAPGARRFSMTFAAPPPSGEYAAWLFIRGRAYGPQRFTAP